LQVLDGRLEGLGAAGGLAEQEVGLGLVGLAGEVRLQLGPGRAEVVAGNRLLASRRRASSRRCWTIR